ncbi:putative glycoside hydrolase [Longimicrobium sp.]|uniref:putative glycoside hydrolase n=1 Tax=Longimicrobium sp. TaxID=2029185 RepID=UPI002EDB050B
MLCVGRRALALAFLPLAFAGCQDLEREARREFSPVNRLAAEAQPAMTVPQPAQAPPRPRDGAPAIIRGIYVNAYVMGNPVRARAMLALADTTEINAFVVDVKDEDGVRYHSAIPMAMEATHPRSIPIHDLKAVVDTMNAHGVYPIARIVVFKDPRLSRARPAWSIHAPDGRPWRDRQGLTWVSPWNRDVWEMNIAIAEEAVRAGFREIQFDYVRFPEAFSNLPRQVHPSADSGGTRADAIGGFLAAARARIHPLGATVTADVFGLSMNESRDVGIGQQWEKIASEVDGVLPMVYPSHYYPTHLPGIRRPNRMPYETIRQAVGMGVVRNERLTAAGVEPARIVPWLQAFTATWNDRGYPYRAEQARAQIQALYDLGVQDWIFWHPSSNYAQIAGAFARETAPEGKRADIPASLRAHVDRMDREGAAAVRAAVAAKRTPSR